VYHACEFDNVKVINCVLSFSTADDKWRCHLCLEWWNGMVFARELYTQKERQEELTRDTRHSLNVTIHNYIVCV